MKDRETETDFQALVDAAASGRPQYIRHHGQVLILIAKASLDDACLKTIRAGDEPLYAQDEQNLADCAYPGARGLFTAPLRRQD